MVIGNGMVAKRFESYNTNDDFIIFASGVSNSKNKDTTACERETSLLAESIVANPNKKLVYFSTCSFYDPAETESFYVSHKRKIENIIHQQVANYYIFRVSNLVGKSLNQNTILNFFYYHIINKINFDLWINSTRNLVDTDDFFFMVDYILKNNILSNKIINIANPISYNVKNIVTSLETILHQKANSIPISKGSSFTIDISLILPVIEKLGINFDGLYLDRLLKKYYLHQ